MIINGMFRNSKGQVLVMVALAMTVLLGITAVAVDVGYLFFEKRKLQTVADSASLAGARELGEKNVTGTSVYNRVKEYVESHNISEDEIMNQNEIMSLSKGDTSVTVVLRGSRGLFFARIFNVASSNVGARATAMIGKPLGVGGLIPIAFTEDEYIAALAAAPGHEATFIDFHIIGAGNWGVLSFEGHGTGQTPPVIADYITNGYPGIVYLADENVVTAVGAAQGGAQGGVYAAIDGRIGDVVYVPIVRGSVNGSKWIEIVNFAAVEITEITGQGSGIGVKGILRPDYAVGPAGRFPNDELPDDYFGLLAVNLVD